VYSNLKTPKDYLTRNSYWQYVGLIYSCKL